MLCSVTGQSTKADWVAALERLCGSEVIRHRLSEEESHRQPGGDVTDVCIEMDVG